MEMKHILAINGVNKKIQPIKLKMMINSKRGTAIKLAIRLLGDSELKYQAIKGSVMIWTLTVSAILSARKRGRK